MRNIFHTNWKQILPQKIVKLPDLSGADLTRSSWAKHIESYTDLPDVYKAFFDSKLANGERFPYVVLTPSHERFIHKTFEKLICDFGQEICVLERHGNTFETQCYPLEKIGYIEFRTALLASSLKICGMTNRGPCASSTLIFNSVTDYLFTPILKSARLAPSYSRRVLPNLQTDPFDHLVKVNYKFMNLAKHSLLGEETVVLSILQPEMRENLLTFLGKSFYKTIAPTQMVILTDRELITIREDITRRREDRYGGIWDFIPLQNITKLSLSEIEQGLLVFSIQLAGKECFESIFQAFRRDEIRQLIDQFTELTAG